MIAAISRRRSSRKMTASRSVLIGKGTVCRSHSSKIFNSSLSRTIISLILAQPDIRTFIGFALAAGIALYFGVLGWGCSKRPTAGQGVIELAKPPKSDFMRQTGQFGTKMLSGETKNL
jgi:hypothetical protein